MYQEPGVVRVQKTPDRSRKMPYYPRTQGRNTGMGICEFWSYLFELNERLPPRRKMTDEEIKRQMIEEFPDRPTVKKLGPVGGKGRDTINQNRQLYNSGRFTRGAPPRVYSYRYTIDGEVADPRTGRPLSELPEDHPARKSGGA